MKQFFSLRSFLPLLFLGLSNCSPVISNPETGSVDSQQVESPSAVEVESDENPQAEASENRPVESPETPITETPTDANSQDSSPTAPVEPEVPPMQNSPQVPASTETPTTTPSGKVIKTSDLAWAANEDVTVKLKNLLGTVEPGDEIQFSHLYRLSADDIQLPNDLILSGVSGAGFVLLDTMTASKQFLKFGSRNTIYNLIFKDRDPLAAKDKVLTNNKWAFEINDKKDVKFVDTYIGTNAKTNLRIFSSERLSFIGVHFQYSYFQVLMGAPSKDIRVERSLFSDSYGDGIKTARNGGLGVSNFVVQDSVYEDNLRDGIDTTGGFTNAVVKGTIFRRNDVSGLDLKNIYEREQDIERLGRGNDNIRIEDCEFINTTNALVLTTLDRLTPQFISDSNHQHYMPNNILIKNSIVEHHGQGWTRLMLVKDAYNISWEGVQLLGNGATAPRIYGTRNYPARSSDRDRPNISRTNYNISGTSQTGEIRSGSLDSYPFESVGPK